MATTPETARYRQLPLYLSQAQGYDAQQIGEVLAWTELPQLLLIPLVPRLMTRIDARQLVGFGFSLFAGSAFLTTHLEADFSGPQFLLPNVIRAVGQALVLTPLSALATAGMEPENAGSASALFDMMRNLGGAIAIAALQTAYTKREQFHSDILTAAITSASEAVQQRVAHLTQYFMAHGVSDMDVARHEAIVAIGRVVKRQSAIMGYADAFFLLGSALLLRSSRRRCCASPNASSLWAATKPATRPNPQHGVQTDEQASRQMRSHHGRIERYRVGNRKGVPRRRRPRRDHRIESGQLG